jgi:hypothetical protein
MSEERNFGVTGAGLGLTVITCLLVALGLWILQRLSGTGAPPPVEVRPSQTAAASEATHRSPAVKKHQQPRVLMAEQTESTESPLPHTAHRPQWLSNQDDSEDALIPGVDGLLTPMAPDESPTLWPTGEPNSQHERPWSEPLQVR